MSNPNDEMIDRWRDAIEQALAFLENDPTTACHRLAHIETQIRRAMASDRSTAATAEPWLAYVATLQARARSAKNAWLAQCTERERRFRARELRPSA